MVRKIENRLYKINTYASCMIIEVDNDCSEDVQEIRKKLELNSLGCRLNLLIWLAVKTLEGYAIASVTEFNVDGSKPKVAYATDKDFKKILKYFQKETEDKK